MMTRHPNTLQEVARSIYWEEGVEISATKISEGLLAAGIRPDDEKERARLEKLIIATNLQRIEDERCGRMSRISAELLDDAKRDLGEDATDREVIELAEEYQERLDEERRM